MNKIGNENMEERIPKELLEDKSKWQGVLEDEIKKKYEILSTRLKPIEELKGGLDEDDIFDEEVVTREILMRGVMQEKKMQDMFTPKNHKPHGIKIERDAGSYVRYIVDPWTNMCRVFRMPNEMNSEWCFGGGHTTNFQMVDWFCPISTMEISQAAVSKEVWKEKVGDIPTKIIDPNELIPQLTDFIQGKNYIERGVMYLVICSFGLTFLVNG